MTQLIPGGLAEGWTKELGPFVCWTDEAHTTRLDLTGANIANMTLILRPKGGGTAIERTGAAYLRLGSDLTQGEFYFSPGVDDLDADVGTQLWRLKITDDAGKVQYFPAGEAAEVPIHRA